MTYNLANTTPLPQVSCVRRRPLQGAWRKAAPAHNCSAGHVACSLPLQYLRPIPLRGPPLCSRDPNAVLTAPRTNSPNAVCAGGSAHAPSGPENPHSLIEVSIGLKQPSSRGGSETCSVFLAQIQGRHPHEDGFILGFGLFYLFGGEGCVILTHEYR